MRLWLKKVLTGEAIAILLITHGGAALLNVVFNTFALNTDVTAWTLFRAVTRSAWAYELLAMGALMVIVGARFLETKSWWWER